MPSYKVSSVIYVSISLNNCIDRSGTNFFRQNEGENVRKKLSVIFDEDKKK